MQDIDLLIKGAKLPEKSATIYLDQGLVAELEALERQRDEVAKMPATLEGPATADLDQRIAALKEQMADDALELRFRALPRTAYSTLLKQHPPREGDKFDREFNTDTFYEALTKASLVSPDLTEAHWLGLLGDDSPEHPGVLSAGQFDKIAWAAYEVNRRDTDVPFLSAGSHRRATSVAGSKQPSDSVSASNGSTAGSPEQPPTTSTTTPAT